MIGVGTSVTLNRLAGSAGGFTPWGSVPGCILALEADKGITLVAGKVDVWADQSSSGNNATAPTAIRRPSLKSDWRNGQSSVFNDDDSILGCGLDLTTEISLSGDFTIVAVRQMAAEASVLYYVTKDGNNYLTIDEAGAGCDAIIGSGGYIASGSQVYASSNKHDAGVFVARRSGTSLKTNLNDLAQKSSTTSTNTISFTKLFYIGGAGAGFLADFAALYIYNNSIADENLALLSAYTNTKYTLW